STTWHHWNARHNVLHDSLNFSRFLGLQGGYPHMAENSSFARDYWRGYLHTVWGPEALAALEQVMQQILDTRNPISKRPRISCGTLASVTL
ncbi:MAG: hypothetical protein ACR2PH_12765, partial [Desulfobulbia bacterium]